MNECTCTAKTMCDGPHTLRISTMMYKCPKCGWQDQKVGSAGVGFTSNVDGAKGDWCLRCYILKTTEGVPQMEPLTEKK